MKFQLFAVLTLCLLAGCQTGGGGGSSANVSQAAIDACKQSADQYSNAAPGTSTYSGADFDTVDENWVLTVVAGGNGLRCTVTADGTVVSIDPIGERN